MIDATGGDTSFGIAGQQDPYNIDISTYFSDPTKVSIKTIRTPPYASSEFDISTVCIFDLFHIRHFPTFIAFHSQLNRSPPPKLSQTMSHTSYVHSLYHPHTILIIVYS